MTPAAGQNRNRHQQMMRAWLSATTIGKFKLFFYNFGIYIQIVDWEMPEHVYCHDSTELTIKKTREHALGILQLLIEIVGCEMRPLMECYCVDCWRALKML